MDYRESLLSIRISSLTLSIIIPYNRQAILSIYNIVLYNNQPLYITNSSGLITFSEEESDNRFMFQDYFDIYVGLVSGKEDVYKHETLGNMKVVNGEDKVDTYIYIENYPCDDERINTYLSHHKKELMGRQIRRFNENNWFEWGGPRNIKSIRANLCRDCIYIHNITRKQHVALQRITINNSNSWQIRFAATK